MENEYDNAEKIGDVQRPEETAVYRLPIGGLFTGTALFFPEKKLRRL